MCLEFIDEDDESYKYTDQTNSSTAFTASDKQSKRNNKDKNNKAAEKNHDQILSES